MLRMRAARKGSFFTRFDRLVSKRRDFPWPFKLSLDYLLWVEFLTGFLGELGCALSQVLNKPFSLHTAMSCSSHDPAARWYAMNAKLGSSFSQNLPSTEGS
jgi:hypothetical protein